MRQPQQRGDIDMTTSTARANAKRNGKGNGPMKQKPINEETKLYIINYSNLFPAGGIWFMPNIPSEYRDSTIEFAKKVGWINITHNVNPDGTTMVRLVKGTPLELTERAKSFIGNALALNKKKETDTGFLLFHFISAAMFNPFRDYMASIGFSLEESGESERKDLFIMFFKDTPNEKVDYGIEVDGYLLDETGDFLEMKDYRLPPETIARLKAMESWQ